jgi:transcriptional regulator of acetoin/glycerol metabolism
VELLESPPGDGKELRPEIASSWRRSMLSGLNPATSVENLTVASVDRMSRLIVAATPILDHIEDELTGTNFTILLADRDQFIVDRRFGAPAIHGVVDRIGIVPGTRFTEETTGTNSVATVFELRKGIAVLGEEHYIEGLKQFSCYGHPITNPLTQRLEGVLDITCPAQEMNPLLAPFLTRAVREIEQRLLDGSRLAEQKMLSAYQSAALRRNHPVLVISEDVLLANAAATELLDASDHALLRELAADAARGRRDRQTLTLSNDRTIGVSFERIDGAPGVLFEFEQQQPERKPIPRRLDRVRSSAERLVENLKQYRDSRTAVLFSGEPGTGRSTLAKELAGDEPVATLDAADIETVGVGAWDNHLDQLVQSHKGLLIVESIQLLPDSVAVRLARVLDSGKTWVALTSSPVPELRGEAAGLATRCMARLELRPLRSRRDELPALVAGMVRELKCADRIRFTPRTLEALASYTWPGNLRELRDLVRHVISEHPAGDITPKELPHAYRDAARARRLTPLRQIECEAIERALAECGGNKVRAAEHLGMSRSTFYRRLRALGLEA